MVSVNTNSIRCSAVVVLSVLACACEKQKVRETLVPLQLSVETQGEDAPSIRKFFELEIFAKAESDALKWKLIVKPKSGYTKALSEELTKKKVLLPLKSDILSLDRNATYSIKFLDADGFVLHEDRAGDYSRITMDDKGRAVSTEKGGAEPVFSQEGMDDTVSYFGSIKSDASKIAKIDNVRVTCALSKDLIDILDSISKSEKDEK